MRQIKTGDILPVTQTMRDNCGNMGGQGTTAKYIRVNSLGHDNGLYPATYDILDADKNAIAKCNGCIRPYMINELKTTNTNMNLIEKAKLAFKGEPEKSFIKVGVMESDESLTEEGQELFLTYLLKKHGDDFKTTVVDPILKEAEGTKE